jgi:hypothetical protein
MVTPDAGPRQPNTSLLLLAFLCANPVALLILGTSPWSALGICLVVVCMVQLCWRRFGTRLPTVYVVNFLGLGGIWLHAEVLVRTRFHDYVMEDLYAQHGAYYFNRPRLVTQLRDKEYAVDYLTNRDGYRIGYSQDVERSVGQVDWLFLGDSYTQGAQVPFESLYTTRLYRRYPDRIVLNAGVSGWGLYESLAFLEDRGATLHPKIVFVQVANFNDFMKVGPRRAGFSDYLMQESEAVRLLLQNIKYVNPTTLPLGRWVEPFYPTDEENRLYNVFYVPSSKEKARDLAEVSAVVRKLAAAAKRLGARLVLIEVPTKEQVSFQYLEEAVRGLGIDPKNLDLERPNRLLRAIADSLQVPVIDPLETWRVGRFPFFHYDEHLSSDGHEMLADAIGTFVEKQGITSSVTMASTAYAGDRYPQFVGPDTLVFHSPRDGNSELLQADIATWTERRLTTDDVPETHPILLPGRQELIFAAGDADAGTTRLWRSDRNGRGAVRLEPRDSGFAAIPAVFPDGTRLVFPSWGPSPDAARVSLTLLDLRTGERETLPQAVEQVWRPAVHPSGRYVAYIGRIGDQYDLFELDLQSRTTRQLTNTPYDEWDPTYTPDGASIVYAARAEGNWDLLQLVRSGGSPVRLTETRGDEWDPQVSPDGRRIAYGGEYGLMRGIYLMDFRR